MSDRSYQALDWPYLLEALAALAKTARGKRVARALPLSDQLEAIQDNLETISELTRLAEAGGRQVPVAGVEEIEPLLVAVGRHESLDAEQLREVAATVGALARLRDYLLKGREHAPLLTRMASAIEIDETLARSLAVAFDERGDLSGKTYPQLAKLRQKIESLDRRVRGVLEKVLDSDSWSGALQDRYVTMSNDRFVLPVKSDAGHRSLGIVHDASRRGQTVYVEPHEAVPLNNDRRIAEAELLEETRRILTELSRLVAQHGHSLGRALVIAAEIDVAGARKRLGERLGAKRPKVADQGVVALRGARHPVLVLQGNDVIANDVGLSSDSPVLVLTGPNAGGKTVALKTVGLCALLVRAGCYIPADEGSRIDLFTHVAADIGDQQTVHEGLSSFSGHLKTLHAMLEEAGKHSLLLLDELCSGTDPAQGGALARAMLEGFADAGARVVTTTHYGQVKAMAADDSRVSVAAMEYTDGRPTFRVVSGMTGESHALSAARHAGISVALIDRARELMDAGERALADALHALEGERAQTRALTQAAEKAERAAVQREALLATREAKLARNARELEREAAEAFTSKLREAEREIAAVVTALRDAPNHGAAREAREKVVAARPLASRPEPTPGPKERAGVPNRQPQVGDRVRVKRLGSTAEVTSVDAKGLMVLAGSMSVRVGFGDVERLAPGDQPKPKPKAGSNRKAPRESSRSAASNRPLVRIDRNTLDLRGERVEAGLRRLAEFLDTAVLDGHDGVFVLHGHGTNAMKDAVRRALRESPYVASAGPADDDQGGDAFTAAVLND